MDQHKRRVHGYAPDGALLGKIFTIARGLGLAPHARIGGGHVHIGRASFDDALAMHNFIVDHCNHPELALVVQVIPAHEIGVP